MTNGFTKFCRLALDIFHHDCESPDKKKGLPTADGAAQNLLRGRKASWKTTTLGALDLKINKSVILLMEEILHHLMWRISHCLQGFIHSRWCRISSINSRENGGTLGMVPWIVNPISTLYGRYSLVVLTGIYAGCSSMVCLYWVLISLDLTILISDD